MDHVITVTRSSDFRFAVRSCDKAIIRLKENKETNVMITIATDNVTLTIWDHDGENMKVYPPFDTPAVLLCDAFKPFWLSWKIEEYNTVYRYAFPSCCGMEYLKHTQQRVLFRIYGYSLKI